MVIIKKILRIITCKSEKYNYLCNMKNFIVNFRTNLNETMSMKINAVCKKQAIQKVLKEFPKKKHGTYNIECAQRY